MKGLVPRRHRGGGDLLGGVGWWGFLGGDVGVMFSSMTNGGGLSFVTTWRKGRFRRQRRGVW